MTEATSVTTEARRSATVTAHLAPADQWERSKRYAESIRYRVTEVRVNARNDDQHLRIAFVGPRVLKDGSDSKRIFDDSYGNELSDIPEVVRQPITAALNAWRAAS